MTATIPARSEIAREHTWDAASVFASDADWNAEFDKVTAMLADLARFQGRLGEGPNVVLDCLRHFEQILRSVGKIYIYASMFHEVDTADQEATGKNARAMSIYGRMIGAAAFIDPELIGVGFDTLRQWMEESAELAVYRQHIDQLERRQQHIRSAEIEEILGQTMEPFFTANATHGILAD
ncbi:MAG TPA: oligoendopeptidase F, partial [Herpetosiphonaceae bacterium]